MLLTGALLWMDAARSGEGAKSGCTGDRMLAARLLGVRWVTGGDASALQDPKAHLSLGKALGSLCRHLMLRLMGARAAPSAEEDPADEPKDVPAHAACCVSTLPPLLLFGGLTLFIYQQCFPLCAMPSPHVGKG